MEIRQSSLLITSGRQYSSHHDEENAPKFFYVHEEFELHLEGRWLTFDSVTDATHDDNSIIFLSKKAAERLCVFRGDTVLVRGRLRRDTVLIVLTGDDVDDTYAAINRVARRNLRVFLGDLISIYPCSDINYVSSFNNSVREKTDSSPVGEACRCASIRRHNWRLLWVVIRYIPGALFP